MSNLNALLAERESLVDEAGAILDAAETENRDLSDVEQGDYDALMGQVNTLDRRIKRLQDHEQRTLDAAAAGQADPITPPNLNLTTKRGEDRYSEMAYFIRNDKPGASMRPVDIGEVRGDNDMVVGTPSAGGYAVPTGHYQGIIDKREETLLAPKLGVMDIPGKGTTVNVPLDASTGGEFVSTAEAATTDRDTPDLGEAPMTLVKYTKRIPLSWELLHDEDSRLMEFIERWVARKMGLTHNGLLITEVTTNGTQFGTFASNSAIAAGELEPIIGNDPFSGYLEERADWVMRSSTLWGIRAITGNNRLYAEQNAASLVNGGLLGQNVHWSNKVDAIGATAKSVVLGNFNYVGLREAPEFEVIRDPYSEASSGKLVLHYYFRAVYKVLQAEAVGYGEHPA